MPDFAESTQAGGVLCHFDGWTLLLTASQWEELKGKIIEFYADNGKD